MRTIVVLSLGAVLALSCSGCRLLRGSSGEESRPQDQDVAEISDITAQQLRLDLDRFEDNFAASIAATADIIAHQTTDRRVRELTLLWKLRFIPTMQRLLLTDDPRYAFLDAWALTVHMRRGFETGATSFGDEQHLATETAKRLEKEIEVIGAKLLSPEKLVAAKKEMEEFAEGHEVSGQFTSKMVRASQAAESTLGNLSGVLSIPISGLSDSAEAIDRLAQAAGVFAEVVQDMPERTRWQTELLLLQLESLIPLSEALRDLGDATESFKSVAATAETLPGDVRKELQLLIESTDEKQANLQKSLQETTKAAEAVNAVLTTIEGMSGDEDETGAEAEKAGEGQDSSFDINEYTRAAEAIQAGALEVRLLLENIESGKLDTGVSAMGETADAAIDRAADRTGALVNRITHRALLVIGVFFSALLLYRLIAIKLARASDKPARSEAR